MILTATSISQSSRVEAACNVLDHVLDVAELLHLLVRKLDIEFLLDGHRDVHHVDFVEAELVPLRREFDAGHVRYAVVKADDFHNSGRHFYGVLVVASNQGEQYRSEGCAARSYLD